MKWITVAPKTKTGYPRQTRGDYTISVVSVTGGTWRFLLAKYNAARMDRRDYLGVFAIAAEAKQAAADHVAKEVMT